MNNEYLLNEEWVAVECADPIYFVSNYGRIKSFGKDKTNGKILKQTTNWAGYKRVGLLVNGKQKIFSVHRLVAEAFIPNPENKPTVNHIDENKSNNFVSNLEWATVEENINYGTHNERVSKSRTGMKFTQEHCDNMSKGKKGKYLNHSSLCRKVQQLTLDGEIVNEYPSVFEAHRQTGFSRTHIACVCSGKEKSLRGFIFRYL